jgi:hypothetical protein
MLRAAVPLPLASSVPGSPPPRIRSGSAGVYFVRVETAQEAAPRKVDRLP